MTIKKFLYLFILLISIIFVSAEEAEERESATFIYDGKNLSYGNLSKEAPFGIYNVEVTSLDKEVIETSEFVIIDDLPQTFNIFFPYPKEGILFNVYYPNGSLMFYLVSRNISKEVMREITNEKTNETYKKQYEERYQTTKKWFIRLVIASVIIVAIMFLYTWKYKMAR